MPNIKYINGNPIVASAVDLAAGSLNGVALTDGTIGTAKLANGSVTAEKLANGSVTAEKLANGVTEPPDNSVTDSKLVQSGGVLTEVHDVRGGVDGLSYASAGDAVRRNDEKTNDRIDQLIGRMNWTNLNPMHFTDLVYGEYIARDGTTISIKQGVSPYGYSIRSSHPIPVDSSKKYTVKNCVAIEIDADGAWVATNENKTFRPSASTVGVWVNIQPERLYKALLSSVGDVGTFDSDRFLIDGYDISSEPLMQTNGIVHQFESGDFQYGTLTANHEYEPNYNDNALNRIRSNRYYLYPSGTTFSVDSSAAKLAVHLYDMDGVYVESYGFTVMSNSSLTLTESRLVKVVLALPDDSVIEESEFEGLASAVTVTSPRQESSEVVDALEKLRSYDPMHLISEVDSVRLSSLTVVEGKLYCAPYADGTYDDHQTMRTGGVVYAILPDGELSLTNETFRHNMGHANTIDYCEANGYLLGSSGGNSSNTQPMEIYLFPDASELSTFDIYGNDTLRIDVSQEGWGKQLNCCWAWDNHGRYDLIWCLTNYQYGNMSAYDTSNVDLFSGTSYADSRRYIRLVQLGKGSVNMGSGTMISDTPDDEFNGTYRVHRTYELPFNMYTFQEGATSSQLNNVDDANNDTCFYGGKIYETPVHGGRASMVVHEFEDYGQTCTTKRITTDDHLSTTGETASLEGEGMAIYRGVMYQVYNNKIQARRI